MKNASEKAGKIIYLRLDKGRISMTNGKLTTLEELAEALRVLKTQNPEKCIVHCHGVFDLLHIGHIRYLERAKNLGEVLIVTLTPDRFVNKGPHRPAFTEVLRAESLAALNCVDFVAINKWPTASETIELLRPDIYAKGAEYRQNRTEEILREEKALQTYGGQMEYIDDITSSSSYLVNQYLDIFPKDTKDFLQRFGNEYSIEVVLEYLQKMRSIKTLIVGEAIIDEYIFCTAIGKSTKDPVLACNYIKTEAFAGGCLAIANHLAGFCEQVGLLTCLGDHERREKFIRQSLLPNISAKFMTKKDSPTIHKRRIVDNYSQNKLLELYIMNDRLLDGQQHSDFLAHLDAVLDEYDLVIVADYGHGMLTKDAIEILCSKAAFLSVNTQSNAGNRGFNPISKYRRADYVCLANHEVAIETRLREGNPRDLLLEVAQRIACDHFTVTRGRSGSLHYDAVKGFTEVPALATRVTDRVGAGDAVLALTSLLVYMNAPWDITGFIGNAAGAHMVSELGNRVPVGYQSLSRQVTSLLK